MALSVRGRKGFPDHGAERKNDSPTARSRNRILSDHYIISNKIAFFNGIGQTR
jgi:hypothetical protein